MTWSTLLLTAGLALCLWWLAIVLILLARVDRCGRRIELLDERVRNLFDYLTEKKE